MYPYFHGKFHPELMKWRFQRVQTSTISNECNVKKPKIVRCYHFHRMKKNEKGTGVKTKISIQNVSQENRKSIKTFS